MLAGLIFPIVERFGMVVSAVLSCAWYYAWLINTKQIASNHRYGVEYVSYYQVTVLVTAQC